MQKLHISNKLSGVEDTMLYFANNQICFSLNYELVVLYFLFFLLFARAKTVITLATYHNY